MANSSIRIFSKMAWGVLGTCSASPRIFNKPFARGVAGASLGKVVYSNRMFNKMAPSAGTIALAICALGLLAPSCIEAIKDGTHDSAGSRGGGAELRDGVAGTSSNEGSNVTKPGVLSVAGLLDAIAGLGLRAGKLLARARRVPFDSISGSHGLSGFASKAKECANNTVNVGNETHPRNKTMLVCVGDISTPRPTENASVHHPASCVVIGLAVCLMYTLLPATI